MNPIRVLVAEDDEDHLFLTIRALKRTAGTTIEVDGVRNGEEAKVDGLGVLEMIKSDPELQEIPVVVLTSSDRQEDVEATYRLGGNSYVVKSTNGAAGKLEEVTSYWTTLARLPAF